MPHQNGLSKRHDSSNTVQGECLQLPRFMRFMTHYAQASESRSPIGPLLLSQIWIPLESAHKEVNVRGGWLPQSFFSFSLRSVRKRTFGSVLGNAGTSQMEDTFSSLVCGTDIKEAFG